MAIVKQLSRMYIIGIVIFLLSYRVGSLRAYLVKQSHSAESCLYSMRATPMPMDLNHKDHIYPTFAEGVHKRRIHSHSCGRRSLLNRQYCCPKNDDTNGSSDNESVDGETVEINSRIIGSAPDSLTPTLTTKGPKIDVDDLLTVPIPSFPNGDKLDKQILTMALPALLNFLIIPLVGAADTFWVGRMKNALALAGQGAANQVFNSAFWVISFLPSVMTPLVAKAHGAGDWEGVRQRIGEAFFLCAIIGSLGALGLVFFPHKALSLVLKPDSAALSYAAPYLSVRGLTILPALLSTIGFAAFRGTMDVVTPLKIAAASNLINVVMDPILIFSAAMGVTGAAAATCLAELASFGLYTKLLVKKKMLNFRSVLRLPSKEALRALILGGASVQLRAVSLNAALLAVTRQSQHLDPSGTLAAAHTISNQLYQLGAVATFALSTVASIIVPTVIAGVHKQQQGQGQQKGKIKPQLQARHQESVTGWHRNVSMTNITTINSIDRINTNSSIAVTGLQSLGQLKSQLPQQQEEEGGGGAALQSARDVVNRLFCWGLLLGSLLALFQLSSLPLLAVFSPLPDVQQAARGPSVIGAFLQMLNCIVWVGEGVMQGTENFLTLAVGTALGTLAMMVSLHFLGSSLMGVWISFGFLSFVRLIGVLRFHFFSGPLAKSKIRKSKMHLLQDF